MMLKVLRKVIRRRGPPSPPPQISTVQTPIDSDLPLSAILTKYEIVSPEPHPHPPSIWTIPLPPELLYFIIDHHLVDDRQTLRALSGTCRVLATYCRRSIFRTVAIGHRNRGTLSGEKKPATYFAKLLQTYPGIAEFIEDLQILDGGGRMFEGSRPITEEEESLCFILTRSMTRLKRLELMLNVVWNLIPAPLQEALCIAFQLPSLRTLSIDKLRFPVNFLDCFQDLRHLEFFGEAAAPITTSCTTSCPQGNRSAGPETLMLTDWNGFNIKHLFSLSSPLLPSQLQSLQFKGYGSAINGPLQLCSSLKVLKLFLVGEFSPQNLSPLSSLRSLTLSQDLTSPLWAIPTEQLQWMFSTLATCGQPNVIEDVQIAFQTPNLARCKEFDWPRLDALFTAPGSWPHLRSLQVVSLTTEPEIQWSGVDYFDRTSPPLLPCLVDKGVMVSFTASVYRFRAGFSDQ